MTDCKHRKLQTWHFADDDQPAGMWSCVACGHKFVPLDLDQERDAARYRWLRELPNADSLNVRFMGSDLDAVIDAELAALPAP